VQGPSAVINGVAQLLGISPDKITCHQHYLGGAYGRRSQIDVVLDAVLARRPRLVLVDELAHTNAPGSRHPKRYLGNKS
jgi:CO/xanthine dehydrogenase Mo-binding subunit